MSGLVLFDQSHVVHFSDLRFVIVMSRRFSIPSDPRQDTDLRVPGRRRLGSPLGSTPGPDLCEYNRTMAKAKILWVAVLICNLPLIPRGTITRALKSTGVALSQQASLRQDISLVILRSRFLSEMKKLYASDGISETAEPGALMFPQEELIC
ncbi:hypothetical protein DY000_02014354 [Brassica cretica]|uniref:HAT C-terminal dimerisation domain-containing protein n=1 Tax=Brassica cretica TaxID=69181 RepID=A0ABQ7CUS2_BRACR|nr:hypothetical protein DY000_02014354 [Brassica cretica]